MLHLYDLNKNKIAGLVNYKDLVLEKDLGTGDNTLSFSYPQNAKYYNEIKEEGYIRTKENEYVIKEKNTGANWDTFKCILNVEDLDGTPFNRFESEEQTIENALNLALVGTGWTVGYNDVTKKRTVRKTNCSSWDIIQDIKKTYMVDMIFDAINKKVNVYEHLGQDKGTYFLESLNIKALEVQSNSYDFYTRIIPQGKDGLTIKDINDGKEYLENYQYSNKVKTTYWNDDRYTVIESLKADAEAKLDELSKPYRAYKADIIDLAKVNNKYKNILDYNLGDTITLISKDKEIKEKQRIVKIEEHPNDPYLNTCEIANAILKFDEKQQDFEETTETVNNVTKDNGTLDESKIDGIKVKQIDDFEVNVAKITGLEAVNAEIQNLHADKADIQSLNAVNAKIGRLEATVLHVTDLDAVNVSIKNLEATTANIRDLDAATGRISVLESHAASIDHILAGNITADNIATGSITAGSGIIAEGAIGDAQINSLSGNKLKFGTIDTSLVDICGPGGRLRLIGNKLQVLDDADGKLFERIMLGVDDNNNSTLVLRDKDGKTTLIDQNGLTDAGFTSGYGKVKDNSLDVIKFDKNSIVRQVNNATETIKGTKVQIGDRTLDVELSTQKNTITEQGKELGTQKATIQALDNKINLKVDNQTFSEKTEGINKKIVEVENNSKAYTNEKISTVNTNLSKATSEINILKGQISSKIEKTDIDKAVSTLEIGGRNLILNSDFSKNILYGTGTIIDTNDSTVPFKKCLYMKDGQGFNSKELFTIDNYNSIKGKTLAISFWAKYRNIKQGVNDWNKLRFGEIVLAGKRADGSNYNDYPQVLMVAGTNEKWNYYNGLITIPNNIDFYYMGIKFILEGCTGEAWVTGIKYEVATKPSSWTPAPEDLDKQIADVITTTTEKIKTAKSEVIQVTDGIKQSITSLDSKTKTIESTVNGKVSKEELKIVTDKTASLETNLNGISGKVSSVEKNILTKADKTELNSTNTKVAELKTTTDGINSKISNIETKTNNHESRIATAEQKITPTAIVNTLRSSDVYKNDLGSKASMSQFTQLQQNLDNFKFEIKQTGTNNLLKNSTGLNGSKYWGAYQHVTLEGTKDTDAIGRTQTGYVLKLGNKESGFGCAASPYELLKANTTYTLSGKYWAGYGTKGASITVICSYNANRIGEYGYYYDQSFKAFTDGQESNTYKPFSFTFTTGPNVKCGCIRIDNLGSKDGNNRYCYFADLMLNEGKLTVPWTTHSDEINGSVVKIDSEEIRADYSDGTYISIGKEGLCWHKAGEKFPYHALIQYYVCNVKDVYFKNQNNGWYRWRVQLPSCFKGKNFTPFCTIQGYVSNDGGYTTLTCGIDWENVNYYDGYFDVLVKSVSKDQGLTTDYNINVLAWAIA